MNTNSHSTNRIHFPSDDNSFSEIDQQKQTIEHRTVPAFMRMISPRWHIDDINRFGDKVGRSAQAMQMVYVTTFDQSLGLVRTFPMPFLLRIYKVMQPQFHWPEIIDLAPPELGDGRSEREVTIRGHKRAAEHLRYCVEVAGSPQVKRSLSNSLVWLEREISRLEAEQAAAETNAAPAPVAEGDAGVAAA